MKKVLSFTLIACMLVMSLCTMGYAAETISPVMTVESGCVGDTIEVIVSIPQDTNAAGGSFNLVYDNTRMELVAAQAGEILSGFSKTVNTTYAENKIRLNFAGSDVVPANGGTLLTASFRLISAGTAEIYTEKFKLADIDAKYLTCENITYSLIIEGTVDPTAIKPIIDTTENGIIGDIIDVTVSIPQDTNAAGGSFNLVYDNTKVELVDAVAGGILNGFSKTVNKTYASDAVRLNFAGSETISANGGTLLTATFRLLFVGTAEFCTEKFKLADIDANYLTCENASVSIAIAESEEPDYIPATGIIIDKTSAILKVGETITLNPTVIPENATNREYSIKSLNNEVVTLVEGVFTAIAPGTATLVATTDDGAYSASCVVTVTGKGSDDDEEAPEITVNQIKTMPGKDIEVTIDLKGNTGFANLGIELGYDSSVLTLIKVNANTSVGATFTPAQAYTANPFNMSWDSASNVYYNGNLVTLTFAVAEDAADGTYPITLDYYKGVGGYYVDGKNVNYDEDFEPVGFGYNSGCVTVANYIPGDINGDQIIDNKDATYLLRYLAGWTIPGLVEEALDVDGSGVADNRDATILLRYLAGWDVTLH